MTTRRKVAIVMSRLRRLVSPNEPWLRALRAVLCRVQNDDATVLLGERTAGADFIRRGCERLGIAYSLVDPDRDAVENPTIEDDESSIPRDDLLIALQAEQLFVLSVRPDGNQHRLLRQRLRRAENQTVLVDLPELQPAAIRAELLEMGAQPWVPTQAECGPFRSSDTCVQDFASAGSVQAGDLRIVEIESSAHTTDAEWLFHSTRACPGPWPETTREEYVESLLDDDHDANHSAMGALKRIVRMRRLISSDQAIRGKYRVVSFSACSLDELSSLHRYRRHRMRWDFEPYGIGIRQRCLEARGARPVIYGDEDLWESLPVADRPLFQSVTSDLDSSAEREWRHQGDLELDSISRDDVILFVPNFEEAKALTAITDWPITLWPSNQEP